jgi:hypothetical protein
VKPKVKIILGFNLIALLASAVFVYAITQSSYYQPQLAIPVIASELQKQLADKQAIVNKQLSKSGQSKQKDTNVPSVHALQPAQPDPRKQDSPTVSLPNTGSGNPMYLFSATFIIGTLGFELYSKKAVKARNI